MSSLPGKRRWVSTIAACYPRVYFWLSPPKRQMTDSGRGKEMQSHLSSGRFEYDQGIFQTRDIRRENQTRGLQKGHLHWFYSGSVTSSRWAYLLSTNEPLFGKTATMSARSYLWTVTSRRLERTSHINDPFLSVLFFSPFDLIASDGSLIAAKNRSFFRVVLITTVSDSSPSFFTTSISSPRAITSDSWDSSAATFHAEESLYQCA